MKSTVLFISGKAGSGKTTLSNSLKKQMFFAKFGDNVFQKKFASVIYEMHNSVRDIARFYGIDYPDKNGPLLQELGTRFGRDMFGEDVWVDAVKNDIIRNDKGDTLYIIDDARFLNEIVCFDNLIHNFNVCKVRLEADEDVRKNRCDSWRDNTNHPSETGLDSYKGWDLLLNSDKMDATEIRNQVAELIR